MRLLASRYEFMHKFCGFFPLGGHKACRYGKMENFRFAVLLLLPLFVREKFTIPGVKIRVLGHPANCEFFVTGKNIKPKQQVISFWTG